MLVFWNFEEEILDYYFYKVNDFYHQAYKISSIQMNENGNNTINSKQKRYVLPLSNAKVDCKN